MLTAVSPTENEYTLDGKPSRRTNGTITGCKTRMRKGEYWSQLPLSWVNDPTPVTCSCRLIKDVDKDGKQPCNPSPASTLTSTICRKRKTTTKETVPRLQSLIQTYWHKTPQWRTTFPDSNVNLSDFASFCHFTFLLLTECPSAWSYKLN